MNLSITPYLRCAILALMALPILLNGQTGEREEADTVRIIPDLVYARNIDETGKKKDLFVDVYLPATPPPADGYPVAVWFHGGGYSIGDRKSFSDVSEEFAKAGWCSLQVSYRLRKDPDSSFMAMFGDVMEDADAVRIWIVKNSKKYKIDTGRTVFGGESAGAEIAYMAGIKTNHPPAGRVTIKGIIDLYGGYIGFLSITSVPPPLFICHGTADPWVPFTDAAKIQSAFSNAGGRTELFVMESGGHNFRDGRFKQAVMEKILGFAAQAAGK